jgi:phosphatidylinositol glycan class B
VLVPWQFLRFNLVEGGSGKYGSHPWHWNFSAGLPALLSTLLPPCILGAARSTASQ